MPKNGKPAGGVAAVCYALAQPVAEELGLMLWDVRFVKEGATWYLRFIIDKEEGVGIDDCVAMSRRMDKLLDAADPVPQSYVLEVKSPGIERELTRPEHFAVMMGWPVTVKLYRPMDGVREFAGELTDYQNGDVTIGTADGQTLTFAKKDISAVRIREDDLDEE